jgi:hypothetical protein
MKHWTVEQADQWYQANPWWVGCNFIPSTAINQLEMWQAETYDPATIDRELDWAEGLGFNTLRVFLHDLVWHQDSMGFSRRLEHFLSLAARHGMKVMFVLFDDCHRPDPVLGLQPLPVPGVHNSGWKQSPGRNLVLQFHDGTVAENEKTRLRDYVTGVLSRFASDERILLWDLYNEPGQSGNDEKSLELLTAAWQWAREVRVTQPLTACLDGACGKRVIELNGAQSDVITFHNYSPAGGLEQVVLELRQRFPGRPILCTEYMARESGSTFQQCLPVFRKYNIGCYNWGLVMGKTGTHWNWKTVGDLEALQAKGSALQPGDPIPEPELWFHDIFRMDGKPYDPAETAFIRDITRRQSPL